MSYQNYVLPDKQREKERVREAIATHGLPVGCVVEYAAQYELDLEILKNLIAEGFRPIWHDKTLQQQPQQSKRGRPRGKASGSLSPIVEKRNGKTYPVIAGERVPKDLAFDYPEQFNWLYQWAEWCDRREKWITRSKRVPSSKVHNIKYMIACGRTVSEILSTLNGSMTNHASPPFAYSSD